ncbi:MAG: DUF1275 family protein [Erythrobacter sp.]|uniref:YoaK family protein n=1 Tax=Erythrobacter sp. TaxID=1042 RepID=UPI0025F54547|nr:DUF1275 family protein [Erythrobacter sp.]MCM0000112.1 DUF1275 family protein [Erythrobacter sp.]
MSEAKPEAASGVAIILAFLAGFVDTAAFIHMSGLFVAHVTGNFVLLGAALATGGAVGEKGPEVLQLAALPIFFAAAMLTGALAARLTARRGLAVILWSASLLTLAVAGASAWLGAGPWDAASAVVLIAAMGMLNAAHRLNPAMGPPFALMTGNVAALAIRAAQVLHLAPHPEGPASGIEAKMLRAVIGFALGCACGAAAQVWLGLAAVGIPAVLLMARLAWRG